MWSFFFSLRGVNGALFLFQLESHLSLTVVFCVCRPGASCQTLHPLFSRTTGWISSLIGLLGVSGRKSFGFLWGQGLSQAGIENLSRAGIEGLSGTWI